MLMGQQQGQINNDLAGAKQQAETTNELAKPELAQAKIDALDAKNQAQNQHQTDTLEATLREHGFKHDDKGNVVPLPYEEMSGTQQAVHDLKASQEELADANSAYKKAQQSNIPIQMQMAAARIATAQKNAETARGRLGLGQQEFEANYMGTHNGEALAGIGTDDSGRPVGTRVANANAATSDRLKRSDLANNVIENTGAIRDLITKNPNLFGKVAGRFTTASQMIGSNDPAISALGVRIHNAALASNGAHGLRSAEAVTQTENELLNHFRNSPKATLAGLDALDDSVKTFIADAKLGKKAGGGASPKPAVKPAPGAPKPNSQNDPMGVL
jgi:hypothetical protein